MRKPAITLAFDSHHNTPVVSLRFEKDFGLIAKVKCIKSAAWSQRQGYWYIPREGFKLNEVFEALKDVAWLDYSALKRNESDDHKEVEKKKPDKKPQVIIPQAYTDLLNQKRYAENTKAIYQHYFADYMRYFEEKDLKEISKEEINTYILELIREKHISASQQNQRINAVKFYYEKVLGRQKENYDIERPRKAHALPDVISQQELLSILNACTNDKNRLIITLIYSAGLRRSEILNLRKQDIRNDKQFIFVRGGKGNKDRTTLLSAQVEKQLENYYAKWKPNYWVFEGPGRSQYSASSVLNIVKNTARLAGINRIITPHMLRHSFATHLIEQGVSLRHIQLLLGHTSSKTTEIYTHIANTALAKVKSPLDRFIEDNTNNMNTLQI